MATAAQTDPRYPVGKFEKPSQVTDAQRREAIATIAAMPAKLKAAVAGLNAQQLATPYRDGGWTVAQVVHHLADSHGNAFFRFKFGMTEQNPTIKPYDEAKWAETADCKDVPAEVSLAIVDGLHQRWNALLKSMQPADFARPLFHPEHGSITLDYMLALYSWHSRHHVGHITALRQRNGW